MCDYNCSILFVTFSICSGEFFVTHIQSCEVNDPHSDRKGVTVLTECECNVSNPRIRRKVNLVHSTSELQ